MTAAVAPIARMTGKGRQPRVVEELQDAREELEAHRQEALAFADAAWPMLSRLEVVAQHIGPTALQTVLALEAMLARYERRHLDPEPEAPAMAVAA